MLVKLTQEQKVKKWLEENPGWLSTAFFEQYMTTSAFHRAIWNLENKHGVAIEHGPKDHLGFRSYRLKKEAKQYVFEKKPQQPAMFNVCNYK